jgi:hypothetical protein
MLYIITKFFKTMANFWKNFVGLVFILSLSIIDVSYVSGQNIIINSGVSVSGYGGYVVIKGNLIDDGTFTNNSNTVVLNGAAQTISGSSVTIFNNLTLGGTGAKTIASGTAVTVASSLVTDDMLTIQSSSLTLGGSLIVNGTTTGTLTYNRKLLTEAEYGDYQYISSPVSSNTATNVGKITDVYSWDEITGTWPYSTITALASGRGYNIDQTTASDGFISFTGSVAISASIPVTSPYADVITGVEGNYNSRTFIGTGGHSGVTRSLTNYGGGGWNLLGNPYTSAILAAAFINENYNSNPALSNFDPNYVALYLYDPTIGSNGIYRYISNSTGWWGTELSQTHIQTGQGFFVLAMNDFSTFNFTRSMQEHATAAALYKSTKSEGRWSGLQLKVKYGDFENYTIIVYHSGMTVGVDPGYDIGQLSTYPVVDIYSMLPRDNGVRFMQQALPIDGCDTIIVPVGVDFTSGGDVTFSALIEPLGGYKFILEDRTAGVLTDLSVENYTVTIPAGTNGPGRFYLRTKNITTTDVPPDPSSPDQADLQIWASDYVVSIKGEVSTNAIATVFDMQAKIVYKNKLNEGSYNTFTVTNATKGIYIVLVVDGKKVFAKKVILF